MTLTEWLALAAVCLMGAASPGPSLAVIVKHTLAGGRTQGLVGAWCHAGGIGVYAVATVFGLAGLLAVYPTVARGVTLAGASYLMWLGVMALRAGRLQGEVAVGQDVARNLGASARDGLVIALLNPKIAVFFTALFSQFVQADAMVLSQWAMAGTAVVIDGLWYSLVALVLARPTMLVRFQAQSHWLNRVSGVLFIAIALRIAAG